MLTVSICLCSNLLQWWQVSQRQLQLSQWHCWCCGRQQQLPVPEWCVPRCCVCIFCVMQHSFPGQEHVNISDLPPSINALRLSAVHAHLQLPALHPKCPSHGCIKDTVCRAAPQA